MSNDRRKFSISFLLCSMFVFTFPAEDNTPWLRNAPLCESLNQIRFIKYGITLGSLHPTCLKLLSFSPQILFHKILIYPSMTSHFHEQVWNILCTEHLFPKKEYYKIKLSFFVKTCQPFSCNLWCRLSHSTSWELLHREDSMFPGKKKYTRC